MGFYMGVDLGGSHGRFVISDADGQPVHAFTGEGISVNIPQPDLVSAHIAQLVRDALAPLEWTAEQCLGLCVAASGVDSPELADLCRDAFTGLGFPADKLLICNDCQVYLFEPQGPAIVVTAGTGAIAFGRSADGEIVRVGGWGHLLSDEGSGFDMGLKALQAVGNHMDGREACPHLFRLFCERSPLRTPVALDQFAVTNINRKKEIACFAPILVEAARLGDRVAQEILAYCTTAHFRLVSDTFRKLRMPAGAPVSVFLWGSLLTACAPLRDALTARIHAAFPGAKVLLPPKSALDTALAVAVRAFS